MTTMPPHNSHLIVTKQSSQSLGRNILHKIVAPSLLFVMPKLKVLQGCKVLKGPWLDKIGVTKSQQLLQQNTCSHSSTSSCYSNQYGWWYDVIMTVSRHVSSITCPFQHPFTPIRHVCQSQLRSSDTDTVPQLFQGNKNMKLSTIYYVLLRVRI